MEPFAFHSPICSQLSSQAPARDPVHVVSRVLKRTVCRHMNRTLRAARILVVAFMAAAAVVTHAAASPQTLTVFVDQATLVKLPEKVATLVVGNPLIADVTLQPGGLMVVTGKGYGATNILALDRTGTILMESSVRVQGPRDNVVVVYRGAKELPALRETYSCDPNCERRITLGDSSDYFNTTMGQTGARNGQAGSAPAK
jgi:hypothetical protein